MALNGGRSRSSQQPTTAPAAKPKKNWLLNNHTSNQPANIAPNQLTKPPLTHAHYHVLAAAALRITCPVKTNISWWGRERGGGGSLPPLAHRQTPSRRGPGRRHFASKSFASKWATQPPSPASKWGWGRWPIQVFWWSSVGVGRGGG